MKALLHLLLFLLCACVAQAQGTLSRQIVVPNNLTNAEGNSSTSDPFTSSSFRLQMVFDASQFSMIPLGASGRIDSISFRIDGSSAGDVLYAFPGSTIQFSTTTRSADSLSPVFADNIGSDVTTVRNGGITFGGTFQPGSNPQPFGQSTTMTSPFWYMPSQGNLLLDIRGRSGQTLFPGGLDAQSTVGDSISRVFANSELFASGTADSLGLVTRFDFTVIPEPSSWTLAVLGLGMLFIFQLEESLMVLLDALLSPQVCCANCLPVRRGCC